MTKYNHQHNSHISSNIREIVFGLEDGMVSTLGAITGIAIGTNNHFTVLLAGIVIIAVESISMGIGSYLANRTEKDIHQRKFWEEKTELREFPDQEKQELYEMFIRDGWPKKLALKMTMAAVLDNQLMLKEMAYRELRLLPDMPGNPLKNGVYMFFFYIIGGLAPLAAYFFLPIKQAVPISIIITLLGLFLIGAGTTKYTKASWLKAGLRIFLLGGIALGIGFLIGRVASAFNQ